MTDPFSARLQAIWQALRDEADLGVPFEVFAERIQSVVAERPEATPDAVVDSLVVRDLYLVLGCLMPPDPSRAIRLFLQRFGAYLHRLSHQGSSASTGDDIEAELLATLFAARRVDDPTSARLYSYRGLGTLQGWLRVTCRRLLIDAIRRRRPEDGQDRLDQLASPGPRVDARMEKAQATALLAPVFTACVAELSADERTLLRRYYRDGHVLREISEDLGIDTSSVFRRLGSARDKIWRRFQRRARTELQLSEGDLRALLSSIAAGLNLDDLFATALVLAGW